MRFAVLCLLVSAMLPSVSRAQGPVFTITTEESDVKFFVKASVAIDGIFNKWEATLTFPSTDATSGVLGVKIYADSVNTGSGMKDDKLKSKDFFNASQDRQAQASGRPSALSNPVSRFLPIRKPSSI